MAAAGPDQVVVTSTDSIRKAYEGPKVDDSEIRSFNPQCTIPMSMRVSQLAFTADSKYLILSAESGGGLAVYDVQSLLQGSTTPTFELPTNGESLRYLTPNPTPEKADLCALVTDKGNLLMANLAERKMSNSLKGQVSCISWSTRGKQLCAGLSDGTVSQLTPEGEDKGQIPKPSSLGDYHGRSSFNVPTFLVTLLIPVKFRALPGLKIIFFSSSTQPRAVRHPHPYTTS